MRSMPCQTVIWLELWLVSVAALAPLRQPLALQQAIARGNSESVVAALEDSSVECDRALAAAALDRAAAVSSSDSAVALASEEDRLARCYEALKRRGLASKFGVAIETPFPVARRSVTPEYIVAMTGNLTLDAFRPSDGAATVFAAVGSVVSILEILLSKKLGLDSPQPLFLATAALAVADQLALRGAAAEAVTAAFSPTYGDRIVRHEAGHVLLAYLLGCPVQGCVLSAREAIRSGGSGAAALNGAAGTAFFDPELNAAARKGRIARSVLDRYCIVVMGGIAAEALCFGSSEGGKDDESALIRFLQETVGFASQDDPGVVANQARWAVLNGVLLLREHRAAYEKLVESLAKTRASSVGTMMMAIEAPALIS